MKMNPWDRHASEIRRQALKSKEGISLAKDFHDRFLPNPFIKEDGTLVKSPEEWPQQAAYIRRLAEENMYGTWPGKPKTVTVASRTSKEEFFRRSIRDTLTLMIDEKYPLKVEYIRPNDPHKHPVIVYNAARWGMRSRMEFDIVMTAGYGIASFDREDIRPDFGAARMLGYADELEGKEFPDLPCGDIMAWGWGHSVVADWLKTLPDTGELICTGHSRGGKAALCAGIFDERFDVVAPIGSGCGGAGCARFLGTLALDVQDEKACETIGSMAHSFPTWMCPKYADFGTKEPPYPVGDEVNAFPLDAHMLRAACAPRAVFNSEGNEDLWTNSFGAQLCRDAAQKVFEFLGVPERNGYHIRPGGHDFSLRDWAALIDFCDIVLRRERKMPQADSIGRPYVIDLKKYAPWA